MAELIASLDSDALNPTQSGINNHSEYAWNKHTQEKITQFYFQLVRCDDHIMLEEKFAEILHELFANTTSSSTEHKTLLYRMIAHTRDLVAGKGEYKLAYMMIYHWAKYDLPSAVKLLTYFMTTDDKLDEPYGSWKDVKYFATYCRDRQEDFSYNLYKYLIGITNIQLIHDNDSYLQGKISLCAKWVPRENKSFGWMYEDLALDYYERALNITATTIGAKNYAKMYYRNMLTKLNKYLDTVQIKMCKKMWKYIHFDNITSITLNKQQYALAFKNKDGSQRNSYDDHYESKQDRLQCAERFSKWRANKTSIKGKNVSIYDFVKSAIQFTHHPDAELSDLLNKQWDDNKTQNNLLDYMIPMVDVSGSMSTDNNIPLYNAIGLGIRIAEQSKLGKRCLTFSEKPSWINLQQCNNFVSCVEYLQAAPWGMNTNFHDALNMILHHIKETKLTAQEVSQLTLVVLSDMQFDASTKNVASAEAPIDRVIEELYAEAGKEICGTPYKPPRIVFWNLRKTSGFPTVSFRPGVSMISGYTPQLMNAFMAQGSKAVQDYNPYNVLKGILDAPRYKFLHIA